MMHHISMHSKILRVGLLFDQMIIYDTNQACFSMTQKKEYLSRVKKTLHIPAWHEHFCLTQKDGFLGTYYTLCLNLLLFCFTRTMFTNLCNVSVRGIRDVTFRDARFASLSRDESDGHLLLLEKLSRRSGCGSVVGSARNRKRISEFDVGAAPVVALIRLSEFGNSE